MHQKHLLRFIRDKLDRDGDRIVFTDKDGNDLTLKETFEKMGINKDELNIDMLDMHANQDTMHRFDKFNAKYSYVFLCYILKYTTHCVYTCYILKNIDPIGKSELRKIFLKIDNKINGLYLAQITKEVHDQMRANKYNFAEYRLSIYGTNKNEWDKVAKWFVHNKLHSKHVRWIIQVPRIYHIFKKVGKVKNFSQVLQNIFEPLFEVTLDPKSHPELHLFLNVMVGFDSVDDESLPETKRVRYPNPTQWDLEENPPYLYWLYYKWINITKLNKLREKRGLNTFAFRPHCGEAGHEDHLASAFLLANCINHGIVLRKTTVLQYLYYLTQIPISLSPLSNNILFDKYDNNPFPKFFRRGLNVTLSTDDPLLIHYTKDPLLEEYSIAVMLFVYVSIFNV